MFQETITLPEYPKYRFTVEQDTDSPNPVKDSGIGIEVVQLAGGYESNVTTDDNSIARIFNEFEERGLSEDKALYATRRYAKLAYGVNPDQIDIVTITGYCQSDWLRLFIYVPNGYGSPDSWARELQMWAYGDVYRVTAEKFVPCDSPETCHGDEESHWEYSDEDKFWSTVSGIYADDSTEASKVYAEAYI